MSRDSWEGDWEEPVTQNRWLYGDANPVNRVDPSGHWTLEILQKNVWAVKEPGDSWTTLYRSLGIDAPPYTQFPFGSAPEKFLLDPFIDILIQKTASLGIGKTYYPLWRFIIGQQVNCYPVALSCASGECLYAFSLDATAMDTVIAENTFNLGEQSLRYGDLFRIAHGKGILENWNVHTGMVILRSNKGTVWTFNGFPSFDYSWGRGYRIAILDDVLAHFSTTTLKGVIRGLPGDEIFHREVEDPTGYYRLNTGIDAVKMRQALEEAGAKIHK